MGFKTGDTVSYISGEDKVTGVLLGIASEVGPIRTWIIKFKKPAVIQTKKGIWMGAIVPESMLSRE